MNAFCMCDVDYCAFYEQLQTSTNIVMPSFV